MTNFVQQFRSGDLNAPPSTGQAGALIVMMDHMLVNGYGIDSVAITSITKVGTTATATVAAADGLRLRTGHILTMSGCTGGDATLYNITATITVASATTFTYTMLGTPGANAAGTPVYSTKLPITGITRSGTTATATLTNANGTLLTGQYITVAGFVETDYNGTFQITVNTGTSISYQVANSPTTPGTGTGVYHKAGLGWTKPYSGTNLAAYLPQSGLGFPQHYYRVSDNALSTGAGKEAVVCGSETMSDVNTGTNKFPTNAQVALTGTEAYGGHYWRKSITADTVVREWTAFGDGATFYLIMNSDASTTAGRATNGIGAFYSFTTADAYNSLNGGQALTNSGNVTLVSSTFSVESPSGTNGSTSGFYGARNYAQAGGSQQMVRWNPCVSGSGGVVRAAGGAYGNMAYPNAADGALWVMPCFICDGTTTAAVRGRLRGMFAHMHSSVPLSEYDTATNVAGLSGVTLTAVAIQAATAPGIALFDTYGPW